MHSNLGSQPRQGVGADVPHEKTRNAADELVSSSDHGAAESGGAEFVRTFVEVALDTFKAKLDHICGKEGDKVGVPLHYTSECLYWIFSLTVMVARVMGLRIVPSGFDTKHDPTTVMSAIIQHYLSRPDDAGGRDLILKSTSGMNPTVQLLNRQTTSFFHKTCDYIKIADNVKTDFLTLIAAGEVVAPGPLDPSMFTLYVQHIASNFFVRGIDADVPIYNHCQHAFHMFATLALLKANRTYPGGYTEMVTAACPSKFSAKDRAALLDSINTLAIQFVAESEPPAPEVPEPMPAAPEVPEPAPVPPEPTPPPEPIPEAEPMMLLPAPAPMPEPVPVPPDLTPPPIWEPQPVNDTQNLEAMDRYFDQFFDIFVELFEKFAMSLESPLPRATAIAAISTFFTYGWNVALVRLVPLSARTTNRSAITELFGYDVIKSETNSIRVAGAQFTPIAVLVEKSVATNVATNSADFWNSVVAIKDRIKAMTKKHFLVNKRAVQIKDLNGWKTKTYVRDKLFEADAVLYPLCSNPRELVELALHIYFSRKTLDSVVPYFVRRAGYRDFLTEATASCMPLIEKCSDFYKLALYVDDQYRPRDEAIDSLKDADRLGGVAVPSGGGRSRVLWPAQLALATVIVAASFFAS